MIDIVPVLVSGVVLGSLYALMATGLSLVWSTLGIFNFAHGIVMTTGAYIAWQVGTSDGLGLGVAAGAGAALLAAAAIGLAVERMLVRPFLNSTNVVLLAAITTLAAMTIIQNLAHLVWGPRYKQLPPVFSGKISIAGTNLAAHEALIVVVAPLLLIGLWMFLRFSVAGTAMRAVSQNRDAAELVGIDVKFYYSLAFVLSAMLAAAAGVLLGSIRFIVPSMGDEPLVKALIVAIFGGLGSLVGTIGGAYVIGISEAMLIFVIGTYWTPTALFFLMIVILMVRPTGLFGKT